VKTKNIENFAVNGETRGHDSAQSTLSLSMSNRPADVPVACINTMPSTRALFAICYTQTRVAATLISQKNYWILLQWVDQLAISTDSQRFDQPIILYGQWRGVSWMWIVDS